MRLSLVAASLFALAAACTPPAETPNPADRVTVSATWSFTGGASCPANTRVVITSGGESLAFACEDGAGVVDDLDPGITQAVARLLDASGNEITRETIELGTPVDRVHAVHFDFTLPLAFGAYRARVLWAIAGAIANQGSCDMLGGATVRVVFGPRPPVEVPCATGFVQFNAAGGDVPITLELKSNAGTVLETKMITLAVTQNTQATIELGCQSGCLAGTLDIDQDPLTGACGCEYVCTPTSTNDPIDTSYDDANCDGSDGVLADCVFVQSGATAIPDGTRAAPFPTIAQAITAAQAGAKKTVCLAGGTYSEAVTLPPGISLAGGYDPTSLWTRTSSTPSTITAAGSVVTISGASAVMSVGGVSLLATNTALPAGASVYALRVDVTGTEELRVAACTLSTQNAIDGVHGSDGAAAAVVPAQPAAPTGPTGATPQGCGMLTPASAGKGGDGVDSAAGTDGLNAAGASANNAGAMCGEAGGAGANGSDGGNGPDAAPASLSGDHIDVATGAFIGSGGAAGGDGSPGGLGSGGGGGGSDNAVCTGTSGGGGGAGGCGGNGGGGGQAGGAGGGAFALFVARGNVVVDACIMTPGNGGRGGDGGLGVNGSGGGAGGAGSAATPSGAGGNGGNGGSGGAGGSGSGGAGGPSVCYARAASAAVTVTNLSCTVGVPGGGGLIGTAGAASATGSVGESLVLPAL